MTVSFHYGGTFYIEVQGSAYLGGETITFDYVDYTIVTLDDFKSIAESKGISKPLRGENEGAGEASNVNVDVREENEGADESEEHSSGNDDESDELFEWEYDMREDKLDDKLFDENVDVDAEWLGSHNAVNDTYSDENWNENEGLGDEQEVVYNEDLHSECIFDEENERVKFHVFNSIELFDPTFKMGMLFSSKTELRTTIHSRAIKCKRSVKITKNDSKYVHAKCLDNSCNWKLHAAKLGDDQAFQIIKYTPRHTCAETGKVKNITSTWLACKYASEFNDDPDRKIKGFRKSLVRELRVHVSNQQAYRCKLKAVAANQGCPTDQYTLLWDYCDELRRTNPGSTVVMGIDESSGENLFERMYICLSALKAEARLSSSYKL
ncbi:Unknown protein [Striga hermonthica]|uniref:Transposase MuDR plant domain-containing protein n=1 Tax=Striga hermonthica TaxID=68872 RepID=A0A9N7NFA5_STRHE|nr:Unknown protein [Striga hermonthica]